MYEKKIRFLCICCIIPVIILLSGGCKPIPGEDTPVVTTGLTEEPTSSPEPVLEVGIFGVSRFGQAIFGSSKTIKTLGGILHENN